VYDSKIKGIEESSNAQIKAIELELAAIEASQKQQDRQEKDNEDLNKISKLQSAIEFEHDEFNKEQLKKELDKTQAEREKRLNKEALEDKKESLRNQITAIKEDANNKKLFYEQQKKEELERINFIYNSEKQMYNQRLEETKKFYEEKTKDAVLQAEAEKLIMDNNQKEIVGLLNSYAPEYLAAGQTLGQKLVDGFAPKIQEIKDMIASINASIEAARANALAAQSYASSITQNSITNNNSRTNNYNVNVAGNNSSNKGIESVIRSLVFGLG